MIARGLRIAVAAAVAAAGHGQDEASPFRPFDQTAFEQHLAGLGADEDAVAGFRRDCGEQSPGLAVDLALRALVPGYGAAAEQAEAGDPRAAVALAAHITAGTDPWVRALARYHLGRVFLDADEPDQAAAVFAEFLREDRNRTPLDAEVAFFYASALADVPLPGEAVATFDDFLRLFPAAPERYRAVAAQRKAELEARFQSPLHDIADDMKGVERRIRHTDTGERTQEMQEGIVTQLEQIIEQLEQQEQQSSGAPSGNQQSQAPASTSALPPGPHRVGNLDKVRGAADRWGDVKDRDREEIAAEVATKFPGHYRKLLEDYYKKLGRGGSR